MTVVSVVPSLNKRHLVTSIAVTFSGEVNATEAQENGSYRLATAGRKGSFTAKNAGIIKLKSEKINATDDVVTLTPKKAFALSKPVQLQISGSIQDGFGRFIDGDGNGQPGGDAIAVIRKKGVVTLASLALARSLGASNLEMAAVDVVLDQQMLDEMQAALAAGPKHKTT